MPTYVLMKIFENIPDKYDIGIQLLTFGKIQKIKKYIATSLINQGNKVLDIGCGTGTLSILMAEQEASVTGIDNSKEMLKVAIRKTSDKGLDGRVELKNLSALELDTSFANESFDKIVSTLVFSELSDEEINFVLEESKRILKKDGIIIVVDEVKSKNVLFRIIFLPLRFFIRLIVYLFNQAKEIVTANIFLKILYFIIEFPLILLSFFFTPPVTRVISSLEDKFKDAGFKIVNSKKYIGGTLQLITAEKL